jgi:transposase
LPRFRRATIPAASQSKRWRKLKLPANIALLPLPPYSSELNPMENVRDYLRANKLFAGVWDSYDEIFAACADAWNWFTDDPQPILGTRAGNSQCLGPLV